MTPTGPRELSRDSTCSDQDVFRLDFPISSSGICASNSRLAAVFFPEKSAVCCIDLKHVCSSSKAKIMCVIPTSDPNPTLGVANNILAVGLKLYDISSSEPLRTIEPPKAKTVTSLDFSADGKILAAGTQTGIVHFVDIRAPTPVFTSNQTSFNFPVSTVRWNKLIDSSFCTVQGDVVSIWDCRGLRSPVVQIASGGWKSPVTSVDWIGPGDLIVSTVNEGLVRVSDISIDFLSLKPSSCGVLCAVPSDTGGGLVAHQSAAGHIDLLDPFSNTVLESFEIGIRAKSIGYLEDSRSLCFADRHGISVRSIARHASGWTSKDGSSMLQSESSPRLHPVASHVTSSDQFLSDEMRAINASFSLIARRVRRLYLQADLEVDPETALLEIGIPDINDRFKLKVALRAEDIGGSNDKPGLSWECWWAVTEGESPISQLPDLQTIQSEFLSKIDLELLADLGECSEIMHAVRELKILVANIDRSDDDEMNNSPPEPFPPTCGVCWSPSGDLFKFQSLKGLGPFPKHRERLTMNNFAKFNDIVSAQTSATNNSVVVHLNEFSEFREPFESDKIDQDDALDEEFNQRVFTDACVQKLPAAVFQNTVEDHWFASLAPHVDFALEHPQETLGKLVDVCDKIPNPSKSVLLVRDSFSLLIELLKTSSSNSALDVVKIALFLDTLTELYKSEQTQAVAVIATLLMRDSRQFSREWNEELFNASLVLIHDHAALFQRLGCFESSRVLEKVQLTHMPNLPVLGEPGKVGSSDQNPLCSACGLRVRGLGQFCKKCGHGGHLNHTISFSKCAVTSCACLCWESPTPKLGPVSTFITS